MKIHFVKYSRIRNHICKQLTAAVTNVSKLLHDSPAFKLLTLDLVVDVIVPELSEPTFQSPNGSVVEICVLHKVVFRISQLKSLLNSARLRISL